MNTATRKNQAKTLRLATLGLLTAVMLIMSFTPLGFFYIGPIPISLNMIPMAIAAIVMGPTGGAVLGGVFGIASIIKCVTSPPTDIFFLCFQFSPVLMLIQCIIARILAGLLSGLLYRLLRRTPAPRGVAYAVTGFSAAFFNTLFFMSCMYIFFNDLPAVAEIIDGRSLFIYIAVAAGTNAIVEMFLSTSVTAAVAGALSKTALAKKLELK